MARPLAPLLAFVTALGVSASAAAQTPPPYPAPYPPPGYAPAPYPPGYGAYPPGYGPGYPPYAPPAYAPPPAPPRFTAPPPPARMDPDDPPPGYHTESRSRRGMVLGGGLMLGIPYLISAGVGAAGITDHNRGIVPMLVPVVGPFITLETSHVFEGTRDQAATVGRVFGAMGLIIDGVLQVGGLSLVVIGVAAQKRVVVRDRDEPATAVPTVSLGPTSATALWRF